MQGLGKTIDGKPAGKHGLRVGYVPANDRPVLPAGESFLCGDGDGGLVVKNSEGTKTLMNTGDPLDMTDTTDASSSSTGSLTLDGGLGVAKSTYVGANIVVEGATDASSSTTGSLKTAGGLGVAKKAFVGTSVHSPSFTDATAVSGVDVTATTATLKAVSKNMVNAAEDLLSFYHGTVAVAQHSSTGTSTGFVSASGNAVLAQSTFTGDTGSTAYTIGDIVKALKLIGIMAS